MIQEFPKDEDGVLYVRQSKLVQMQKNIHSYEMQTGKFVEHFRNNLHCTGHIEIIADDEGVSGTKDIHEREGLARTVRLIQGKELINGRRIRWVGAVHVNRLTRDPWLITPAVLMKECYEHEVWISTLRMNFNFDDEYCQRVFMLEAEEAARHLKWMKLIMGGARSIASSNGYYDGRWLVPGYIVDRTDSLKKKYIIYEPHAEVVRWLFRRFLELDGDFYELCREIDKKPYLFPKFEPWVDEKNTSRFGGNRKRGGSRIKEGEYAGCYKPTDGGIRSILCNPVYIGWWLPIDGGVVENNHDAIVDEALFTFAHKRLSTHDLNGERQRPAKVTRTGAANAMLKKVLHDDMDKPMYAGYAHDPSDYSYISRERTGLATSFRFSLSADRLDKIFLDKLFERLEALEKLEDWEDKLTERLTAKEYAQEEQKKLIQKNIEEATRQRQVTMDILDDPEIPKTKQMKIDYANKIAGLEAKIAQWQQELEAPEEEEDEEVTLYEIHSLLPNIVQKWDKLSLKVRLRFIGALVRKVTVAEVAPSWLQIEIHWKETIGNFTEVGYFKRFHTNRSAWSEEEEAVLRDMYPKEDASVIIAALPERSWRSIYSRAGKLGIKRERRRPNLICTSDDSVLRSSQEDREFEAKMGVSPSVKEAQWRPPSLAH